MKLRDVKQRIATGLVLMGALALAIGCGDEGPAEKAGRAIDEAVAEMGESIEDALDDTKDAFDEKVDDMKEKVRESTGS